MEPEQIADINSFGLSFALCMCLLVLLLSRRNAPIPIILAACYMTVGQQIIVGDLHFTVLRVLVLAAYLRVILRREARRFTWCKLDTLVLCWGLSGIVFYTLWWQTPAALINRLGVGLDRVGMYFVFRFLLRDLEDTRRVCGWFAIALLPLALCIGLEKASGQNLFYALGGVPKFAVIRENIVRCQGPFRHPILAGTFGAIWLPLCIGLAWDRKGSRFRAALGIISSTVITVLSGSSGPLVTYFSAVLALAMLPIRKYMRSVRWAVVAFVLALQIAMQEPVWFIFAHVNVVSGSTGWHRSHLIDQTIRHFSEWWLAGTDLANVGKWGVWYADVTNQYLLEGLTGGMLTLAFFIGVIVVTFSNLGRAIRFAPANSRRFLWAIGATVFAHVMTFLSVAYFDQNSVNWCLVLAMSAAVVTRRCSERRAPAQVNCVVTSDSGLITA
jgi:hypothetical protein